MPKVRTTISIDESVLEDWRSIARIQRSSVSSLINDWLEDLADSARYKAVRLQETGQDTKLRISELNTALAVIQEGYQAAINGKKGSGSDRASAQRVPLPPSSNTGGKGPKTAAKGGTS